MKEKPAFRVEPANRDGIRGFLLHQMEGTTAQVSQFIPAEAFPDFIAESGIDAEQINTARTARNNSRAY